MIRQLSALLVIGLIGLAEAHASSESLKLYYSGSARITSLSSSAPLSHSDFILMKEYNPKENLLVEISCFVSQGKPASVSPVFMRVNGNQMLISDSLSVREGKLTGTGYLRGEPWNWNELHFSMSMKLDYPAGATARIEDVNFVVGRQLIARKQIYFFMPGVAEHAYQLWDTEALQIEESRFKQIADEMGCPSDFTSY